MRRPLPSRVTIAELHKIERSPLSGIADSGRCFAFPIPHSFDSVEQRSIERDGKTIGLVPDDFVPYGFGLGNSPHLAPNDRLLVVEHSVSTRPMLVVDLDNGKWIEVPDTVPLDQEHYNVYSFQFIKWAADSSSLLVGVSGYDYREVWRVEPMTGKSVKVKRELRGSGQNDQWPQIE